MKKDFIMFDTIREQRSMHCMWIDIQKIDANAIHHSRNGEINGDINMTNKWEESIKKIPQKDEFELEGIKNWHIYDFEMIPNSESTHEKLFREEAVKLLDAGFNLAINTDHGVGSICTTNDGFVIELWQYNKKEVIHKKSLDEVLDWIIYFYDRVFL